MAGNSNHLEGDVVNPHALVDEVRSKNGGGSDLSAQ